MAVAELLGPAAAVSGRDAIADTHDDLGVAIELHIMEGGADFALMAVVPVLVCSASKDRFGSSSRSAMGGPVIPYGDVAVYYG